MRREIMEAVPCLVHQRLHVIGHADRVHENEWTSAEGEIGTIATRCFADAAFEIEESLAFHDAELFAKLRIDACENVVRAIDECRNVSEWTQWFGGAEIDGNIPGTQWVNGEFALTMLHQSRDSRRDGGLYSVMKTSDILGGVVEAMLGGETELLIVTEPGFRRDRRS